MNCISDKKVFHFENETRCGLECWESVIHFNYCQSKSYSFPWGFITLRNTLLRAPCGFDKWHEESSIGNNFLSLATRIQSIVILNTHILHIILLELIQYWMRYRHRTRTNNIDILGSRVQGPVTGVRQMSHSYWLLHGSIIQQSRGLDRVIISPTLRLSKDTGQSCVYTVWSPQSAELQSSGSGVSGPVGVSCINNVTLLPTPKVSSA